MKKPVYFSERDLPNNKGQLRKGSRMSNQDFYRNSLILHTEKTYRGDNTIHVENPTSADFSGNALTIFNYLDEQVKAFFADICSISPCKFAPSFIQTFLRRKYNETGDFEDDGETKTEGFEYKIYWAVPLGKNDGKICNALSAGLHRDSIYFTVSFDERIHDGCISNRFLYLYCDFTSNFSPEHHSKDAPLRIAYNNDNMPLGSIFTPLSLYFIAKNLNAYLENRTLYEQACGLFED